MIPPGDWKATRIDQVPPSESVFFDTSLIGELYESHRDPARPWFEFFNSFPTPRRVVNEVVHWELRRAKQGREWGEWLDRSFTSQKIDMEVVQEFRRLLHNVLREGTGYGGAADGLIAAHVLRRRWFLATKNVDDFCNIPGLLLVVPR